MAFTSIYTGAQIDARLGGNFTGVAVTATSFNSITGLASVAPLASGAAAVGISTLVARQDHVHPTDTTRAPTLNPTFTGVAAFGAGAVGAPAIHFGDTATGLYKSATNCVATAINGVKVLEVKATGVIITGHIAGSGNLGTSAGPLYARASGTYSSGIATSLSLGYDTTGAYGWIQAVGSAADKPILINALGGNVILGATADAGTGKLQVTGTTTSTAFNTAVGQTPSTDSGSTYTFMSLTGVAATFMFSLWIADAGVNYQACAIITFDGTDAAIQLYSHGSGIDILLVGGIYVQAKQTSGSAKVMNWSMLKIA